MQLRQPVYIIGEGLTEKYYFKHLKKIRNYEIKIKPRFFSKKNSIHYLAKKTKELLRQEVFVICVFDADVAIRNPQEKKRIIKFKRTYSKNKNLILCDSLPSIEFWFLLHFQITHKQFTNYKELRNELQKKIPRYDKNEKFLQSDSWVKQLIKRQNTAVNFAIQIKDRGGSYSNVYKAIEFLEK